MKKIRKILALLVCVVLALSLTACRIVIDGEEDTVKKTSASGSIGLSVSTLNNPFFVSLAEGAEGAANTLGVDIAVVDAGDDVTKQVSDIEDLVAKGISVLIVNPCDSDAVTGAVEAAKAKGVKFGRPPLPLPDNFYEVHRAWRGKKLTPKEAANACNMPVGTFYGKARKFENVA